MKNLLVVAIFSAISITFFSCEKDETNEKQPVEYDAVSQSIINFKTNMDKKSTYSDPISPDSLVWYIEATFNMYYGHPGTYHDIQATDSLLVSVNLVDGCEVTPEDVYGTYVTVNNFFYDAYESFDYDPKELVVMDLKLLGTNVDAADLMVYVTIGKPDEEASQLKTTKDNPFQYYDFWNAIAPGRCNGYNTSYPSTENAMDQLMEYYMTYNDAFEYLDLTKVYDYYFTSIDNSPIFHGVDEENWDAYIWDDWNNPYTCLAPSNMNYFLQSIDEVIIDNNPYTGKKAFNLNIYLDGIGNVYCHTYECDYGNYHWRPFPVLTGPSKL